MRCLTHIWIVSLMCLLFIGCNSYRQENDSPIYYFSESEEISLSDLFSCDHINRIQLQDPDKVLMSSPAIFRMNDKYMVACQPFGSRQGVWLFAMNGTYLGNIGRIGRGPGEYIMPMEILMNDSDTIYIEDKGKKEILAYSLSNRKAEKTYPFTFNSKCVALDKTGNLVWYVASSNSNTSDYENLVKTDISSNVLMQCSPVKQLDHYSGMWQTITLFSETPTGLIAHHQFQPELFPIDAEKGATKVLQFENHKFAPESFNWQKDGFRERISTSSYVQYYDVFETSTKMYVRFCAGKNIYLGIYDKEHNKGRYCDIKRIDDDLDLGCIPRVKGVHNDHFFCLAAHEEEDQYFPPSVVWFE